MSGQAVHPDHRKVFDLDSAEVEHLVWVMDLYDPSSRDPETVRLRAFLASAERVRLEIPQGTATLGNGFAAAFAAGPGFAHDEPDEVA